MLNWLWQNFVNVYPALNIELLAIAPVLIFMKTYLKTFFHYLQKKTVSRIHAYTIHFSFFKSIRGVIKKVRRLI